MPEVACLKKRNTLTFKAFELLKRERERERERRHALISSSRHSPYSTQLSTQVKKPLKPSNRKKKKLTQLSTQVKKPLKPSN